MIEITVVSVLYFAAVFCAATVVHNIVYLVLAKFRRLGQAQWSLIYTYMPLRVGMVGWMPFLLALFMVVFGLSNASIVASLLLSLLFNYINISNAKDSTAMA